MIFFILLSSLFFIAKTMPTRMYLGHKEKLSVFVFKKGQVSSFLGF